MFWNFELFGPGLQSYTISGVCLQAYTGRLSNQGEKSINFYFIRVPLRQKVLKYGTPKPSTNLKELVRFLWCAGSVLGFRLVIFLWQRDGQNHMCHIGARIKVNFEEFYDLGALTIRIGFCLGAPKLAFIWSATVTYWHCILCIPAPSTVWHDFDCVGFFDARQGDGFGVRFQST